MQINNKITKRLLIIVIVILFYSCTNIMSKAEKYITNNNYDSLELLLDENDLTSDQIRTLLNLSLSGYKIDYKSNNKIIVEKSRIKIIGLLISHSEDPNVLLEDGSGILFWALKLEDKSLFQMLIDHKNIDLNITDKHQNYLVSLYFKNIDDDLFDVLLRRGINFCHKNLNELPSEDHPFNYALHSFPYKDLARIIEDIKPEDIAQLKWNPMNLLFQRYWNQTLLNQEENNRKLYFKLKSLGVPLTYVNEVGGTLLHSSISSKDLIIMKDLLEAGVDVNSKVDGIYTAFYYAVLQYGSRPGKIEDPIIHEIQKLFNEYGYIHVDY